jgi:hypothetical protein
MLQFPNPSPWMRDALRDMAEAEDGPRTLDKWNAWLRDAAMRHGAKMAAIVREIKEAERGDRRCLSAYRGRRCDRTDGHDGRHEAADPDSHSWSMWDNVAADAS